jgi:glycine betaine/choline ABC-type transport system substrate-binding protein
VSVPRGCARRRECLPALERAYGARFRRVIRVRQDVRQEPLRHRRARAGVVHSTDPQLVRNGLTLLADDRRAFPHAGWVLLVRKDALGGGEAPERVAAVANHAVRDLSAEVMQELVARVALDQRQASAVARQYLTRSELVR